MEDLQCWDQSAKCWEMGASCPENSGSPEAGSRALPQSTVSASTTAAAAVA